MNSYNFLLTQTWESCKITRIWREDHKKMARSSREIREKIEKFTRSSREVHEKFTRNSREVHEKFTRRSRSSREVHENPLKALRSFSPVVFNDVKCKKCEYLRNPRILYKNIKYCVKKIIGDHIDVIYNKILWIHIVPF